MSHSNTWPQLRKLPQNLRNDEWKPAPKGRWRDWASKSDGITGDELLAFINREESIRPDGTRDASLFRYLCMLTSSNGDDHRDVFATVFKAVDNRMKSGYLLRALVNKIAGIHFTSSDGLHTLGTLYESMFREMRDAAGDSSEVHSVTTISRIKGRPSDTSAMNGVKRRQEN